MYALVYVWRTLTKLKNTQSHFWDSVNPAALLVLLVEFGNVVALVEQTYVFEKFKSSFGTVYRVSLSV